LIFSNLEYNFEGDEDSEAGNQTDDGKMIVIQIVGVACLIFKVVSEAEEACYLTKDPDGESRVSVHSSYYND